MATVDNLYRLGDSAGDAVRQQWQYVVGFWVKLHGVSEYNDPDNNPSMSVDDEPQGYNSSINLKFDRHLVVLGENGRSEIMTVTVMDACWGHRTFPQGPFEFLKYEGSKSCIDSYCKMSSD